MITLDASLQSTHVESGDRQCVACVDVVSALSTVVSVSSASQTMDDTRVDRSPHAA